MLQWYSFYLNSISMVVAAFILPVMAHHSLTLFVKCRRSTEISQITSVGILSHSCRIKDNPIYVYLYSMRFRIFDIFKTFRSRQSYFITAIIPCQWYSTNLNRCVSLVVPRCTPIQLHYLGFPPSEMVNRGITSHGLSRPPGALKMYVQPPKYQ